MILSLSRRKRPPLAVLLDMEKIDKGMLLVVALLLLLL